MNKRILKLFLKWIQQYNHTWDLDEMRINKKTWVMRKIAPIPNTNKTIEMNITFTEGEAS